MLSERQYLKENKKGILILKEWHFINSNCFILLLFSFPHLHFTRESSSLTLATFIPLFSLLWCAFCFPHFPDMFILCLKYLVCFFLILILALTYMGSIIGFIFLLPSPYLNVSSWRPGMSQHPLLSKCCVAKL